jgi:hypothetical protein
MNCIHEFPSVVGPPRHECEFGLFFGDEWTPAHLTGGKTNLYKEIAFALKGVEWRQPGLVAVASKIAGSAAEHKPIDVKVPDTYVAKKGRNKWQDGNRHQVETMISSFDFDRDFVVSADELHALVTRVDADVTVKESARLYRELLETYDSNGDGQLSVEEVAAYWVNKGLGVTSPAKPSSASDTDAATALIQRSASEYLAAKTVPTLAASAPSGALAPSPLSESRMRAKGMAFATPAAAQAVAPATAQMAKDLGLPAIPSLMKEDPDLNA